VSDFLPEAPEWLLTTMLDNDDDLHEEYVATVQAAQSCEKAEILNCTGLFFAITGLPPGTIQVMR
jgi:hypothetical protein